MGRHRQRKVSRVLNESCVIGTALFFFQYNFLSLAVKAVGIEVKKPSK